MRDLEGPVEDRRELVGALDLDAPLDQGLGHCHQVVSEQGLAEPERVSCWPAVITIGVFASQAL